MQITSVTNPTITMTSLELVAYINSQRGEGEAELRHDDFLRKVPKVLGEEMAATLRASYLDSMNREKPSYTFPKREACLMAMSYSYELQAKVFDQMTHLEEQVKALQAPTQATLAGPSVQDTLAILSSALKTGSLSKSAVTQAHLELLKRSGINVQAETTSTTPQLQRDTATTLDLLKQYQVPLKVCQFLDHAVEREFLMPSSNQHGEVTKYTPNPLFGVPSGKSPRWFPERFPELLVALGLAEVKS